MKHVKYLLLVVLLARGLAARDAASRQPPPNKRANSMARPLETTLECRLARVIDPTSGNPVWMIERRKRTGHIVVNEPIQTIKSDRPDRAWKACRDWMAKAK